MPLLGDIVRLSSSFFSRRYLATKLMGTGVLGRGGAGFRLGPGSRSRLRARNPRYTRWICSPRTPRQRWTQVQAVPRAMPTSIAAARSVPSGEGPLGHCRIRSRRSRLFVGGAIAAAGRIESGYLYVTGFASKASPCSAGRVVCALCVLGSCLIRP